MDTAVNYAAGIIIILGVILFALGAVGLLRFPDFLTSPTATHAIARAALKNKLPVWTRDEEQ